MKELSWLQKFKEISIAWKNVIFRNEAAEQIAFNRASICAGCDHNIFNTCSKCGCPLVAKMRNPDSKCPMNKW